MLAQCRVEHVEINLTYMKLVSFYLSRILCTKELDPETTSQIEEIL